MGKFNIDSDEYTMPRKMAGGGDNVGTEIGMGAANMIKQQGSQVKSFVGQGGGSDAEDVSMDASPVTLSSTRGRKGQKLPTMNMRFTPENYEYMKRESAVRGMSATALVNWLIEEYRKEPGNVHYDPNL